MQYVQKTLENYYKTFSSTIFVVDGLSVGNINCFHAHIVVRRPNDIKEFYSNKITSNKLDDENSSSKSDLFENIDYEKSDVIYDLLSNYEIVIRYSEDNKDLLKAFELIDSIQNSIIKSNI